YISTDYVFDGENISPYREYDLTNPMSIYGKSKVMGELYTQMFSSKYFIIRTAWLYGDGDNFIKTMMNLSKTKSNIDVVSDQFGSPTSTKDLANCIINLMNTELYGIYNGTCNGVCSWYEFACKIFKFTNTNININPVTSENFQTRVVRPKFSVLDNFMLRLNDLDNFRTWEYALEDYLTSN
ncbi:MAG: SDR family oxidoreductase, partial [Bacilli bacterium]